jgi:hypothetical protein
MCLMDSLSCADSGAQLFRERLQQLPSDSSVAFDKRAELPECEPIANQVGCSGDCRRARTAVNQGNLAEIIAGAESGQLDAFA